MQIILQQEFLWLMVKIITDFCPPQPSNYRDTILGFIICCYGSLQFLRYSSTLEQNFSLCFNKKRLDNIASKHSFYFLINNICSKFIYVYFKRQKKMLKSQYLCEFKNVLDFILTYITLDFPKFKKLVHSLLPSPLPFT